ncbi:hypothetical protein F4809DRAFT_653925 [Biscogniauxia mediterranea]|nr:hypothetical protein F4809DRAFT_653925 [Biscogniauxia mediterranea]
MSNVGTPESAIAVGFSFPIIDGILIGLRFYTRQNLGVKYQLDDWLCIPAWLCLTGCCASLLGGVFLGAFDEMPLNDPDKAAHQEHILAQITAALVILWMGANFLVKLIMLFFYRRIFVGRVFNICNWVLIGLSGVWFIYAVASWLFYCGTHFVENVEGPWRVCPHWGFAIQMGVFALDSFIDLNLLILPIPFVWRLQLDLKRKMAITVVFILGGFAFVAGLNNTIIQLVYLTEPDLFTAESGSSNFFQGSSLLFSNWPAIEIGVGLLASNLPHLSVRVGRAIKERVPQMLLLSLDSARHAAAALSLRSQKHPYRNRSRRPSAEEPQNEPAGSTQVLWADATSGRSEHMLRTKSAGQSSGGTLEIYELRDVKVSRTGDDIV